MIIPHKKSPALSRIDMHRYAPFRTPHWRWDCANAMRIADETPPEEAEPMIARAMRYQQLERRAGLPTAQRTCPAVAMALTAWQRDDHLRWELEGRILADQPIEQIAHAVSLPVDAVEAYEALFCDARPSHAGGDWILTQVIGLSFDHPTDPPQPTLWRLVGSKRGIPGIDAVAGDYLQRPCPDRVERRAAAQQALLEVRLYHLLFTSRGTPAETREIAMALCDEVDLPVARAMRHELQDLHNRQRKKCGGATIEQMVASLIKNKPMKPVKRSKSAKPKASPSQAPMPENDEVRDG